MVFPDIFDSVDHKKNNSAKIPAHLMDRFFSFLIDYLVISPFVLFMLYLTFSNGFAYWKSHPAAPESDQFILILSLTYVVYFSLLQSLFTAVWKATPGQFFLKIRLDFHESENFIFFRALIRHVGFWGSFLFLGIPFLSVMTNRGRCTFYDRIADVSVVSRKDEQVFFDFEKEYRYWQSFMATLVLFVGFLFSALIWKNYEKIIHRAGSFAVMQQRGFFCEDLASVKLNERLQMAVALNLVNQMSDDCLDREADFVLWKQKKGDYSLAYYAKSLTTTDGDKEALYLQQACAGEDTAEYEKLSQGCRIAFSFRTNRLEQLYVDLKEENFLADSLRYELGLILNKESERAGNFSRIAAFNTLKPVKKYQIAELLARYSSGAPAVERAPASAVSDEASDADENQETQQILNLLEDL